MAALWVTIMASVGSLRLFAAESLNPGTKIGILRDMLHASVLHFHDNDRRECVVDGRVLPARLFFWTNA
jgi:hypothetical protein